MRWPVRIFLALVLVTVVADIAAAAPLTITTASLPGAVVGAPYSATLTVTGGVPPYTWSATALPQGLNVTATGVINGIPTTAGTFNLNVSVKDNTGAIASQILSLVVSPPALAISVSPNSIVIPSLQVGQQQQTTVHINSSPPVAPVTVTVQGPAWISTNGTPNSLPGDFNLIVSASSISPGATFGIVTVQAFGPDSQASPATISVSVTVVPAVATTSPLAITTTSLPQASVGSSYSAAVAASGGVQPYTWSATGLPPGLSISAGGVISGTPTFIGTFNPTVTVKDNAGTTVSKTLSLSVVGVATLTVSPNALSFSAQSGQRAQSQSIHITENTSTARVKIDSSYDKGTGWLSLSQSGSSLDYDVVADAASLTTPGTYTGTLTVSCADQTCNPSAVPARVTFTVSAASQSKLVGKPASLTFQAYQGRRNPASQTVSLTTDDGSPLGFTVSGAPSWIQISPMSGTASSNAAILAVTANTSALSIGANTGDITITPANNSPGVSFSVGATLSAFSIGVSPNAPPAVNLAPGVTQVLPLNVSTADGLPQDIAITAKTASGGNWLKAPATGINGPGQANITLDSTGLNAGNYSGTVTFSCALTTSNDAACAAIQVPISLTVSSSNTPTIRPGNGVISASNFGGFSTISPGSYIEIYGTNLSLTNPGRTWAGKDFSNNGQTAPTSLDGTTVSVGGQAAFVFYVSPTQVNALVPSGAGTGPSQVVVTSPTGTTSPYAITINPVQPGLLAPPSFQSGGKQYVGALFPDGATFAIPAGVVAGVPARPAKPGDTIIIYGVGFGPVTPRIDAGTVVSQANSLTMPLQVLFGDTRTLAQLAYSGLAPSFTGLYQLNVVVPDIPDNDAAPLTFNLGGVQGAQTLYIAVHH